MDYQVALVTGATGDIGKAIAQELVKNGMKVVITGRNQEKLNKLASELKDGVVYYDTFDINDYEAMKKFYQDVKDQGITIDVLVNNAGLALGLAGYQDNEVSDIITMLDTNIKSVALLSHLVLQDMKLANHGHIIHIGSVAGQFAYANGAIYCASKAAVKTMADGMRVDLVQSDIKITTIQPGMVETNFSMVRFKGDKAKADAVYQGIDALQPIDCANAVWFCLNQPKRCQISELTLLANQQGNAFTSYKK
ncbi:MAG: SDR family NAD(P)-dependent oxidoreductase [Bacilli bacterium]|jgi:NADP-dependent 3-hydroxy acid dehydrogenase YdfG|nr:SDR family NAD(P)-dependent oxidoreductase [Bacilli bacterium]